MQHVGSRLRRAQQICKRVGLRLDQPHRSGSVLFHKVPLPGRCHFFPEPIPPEHPPDDHKVLKPAARADGAIDATAVWPVDAQRLELDGERLDAEAFPAKCSLKV